MVIYKTTNLINGKQYIGKDKNNDPNYIGSGTDLKIAIKEYGKRSFKKEIIEHCDSINHLIERETYWLNYYDVKNSPNFYNKTNKPFGNSGLSEETKKNIKQGLKKRIWNPEWGKSSGQARVGSKRNIKNGNEHKNTGKIRSEEDKKKMSLARIGKKHNLDWCSNIKNNRQKCIEVKSKSVIQLDKNNNIIKEYKSITEARNETGIKGIPNTLIGKAKTAGGFIWKYK
jgi:group I intron endonuclease